MQSKIILITGATSGIGKETALALARLGNHIVIVGRNKTTTLATVEWLKKETGNSHIDFLLADLSIISEIKKLAQQFAANYSHLDVLINNAGGFFTGRQLTSDGFEKTWMTNYLSPVLLTELLLEKLKASPSARIINVSSALHKSGRIDFDNLNGEKKYKAGGAYSNSKIALVMYTYTLAKKLQGTSITANVVHPGVVATQIGLNNVGPFKSIVKAIAQGLSHLGVLLTPEQGAKTSIYLASSSEVQGINGKYFVNCKEAPSTELSYDQTLQEKLWKETHRILQLNSSI